MTPIPVTLTLPFPPSVNNLFTGRHRRYPTAGYKRWRHAADVTVMAARSPRITAPVSISVVLHPADNRPRDADNYLKCINDCLVRMQVISHDDKSVVRGVSATWGEHRHPPEAVVTITPVE